MASLLEPALVARPLVAGQRGGLGGGRGGRAASPGATCHCPHPAKPADAARAAEYEAGPYAGVGDQALQGLAALEPEDADPAEVARAIVRVIDAPFGKRPFRVHIDPSQDGAEIVNGVADRVRREMFRNIGLADLLSPSVNS